MPKFVARQKDNKGEDGFSYYDGPASWEGARCTGWNKLEKAKRFDTEDEARKEIESIMGSWAGYEVVEDPSGEK